MLIVWAKVGQQVELLAQRFWAGSGFRRQGQGSVQPTQDQLQCRAELQTSGALLHFQNCSEGNRTEHILQSFTSQLDRHAAADLDTILVIQASSISAEQAPQDWTSWSLVPL